MGAATSQELKTAQSKITRLTTELQHSVQALKVKETALASLKRDTATMLLFKDELQITKSQLQVATEELKKSKKHAEAVPNLMRQLEKMNRSEQSKEQRVRALEAEVQSAKVHQQELQQTRSQLEAATEELNRSKQNADALPTLKQKLEQLQDSEARSRERVLILEDELRFSKEQVEDALSKLKFAEQESRTRARRRPAASEEETRTRRHEDEAFELGVQCVAEANRALVRAASDATFCAPACRSLHLISWASQARWTAHVCSGSSLCLDMCADVRCRALRVAVETMRTRFLVSCFTTLATRSFTARTP
eukprot:2190464-Pleurochrysis_carterae.AAC.4